MKSNFKLTAGFIALSLIVTLPSVSLADDQQKEVSVFVNKSNSQSATVELIINDRQSRFSLPEMSEGESQQIATESGELVTIHKNKNGYVVEAGGENIDIPMPDADLSAHLSSVDQIHQMASDKVLISGVDLDDHQKQIIRDAFAAAGIEREVNFSKQNIMVLELDGLSPEKGGVFHWESKDESNESSENGQREVHKEVIILKQEKKD